MDKSLFGIANFDAYVVIGIIITFSLLEIISGYLHRTQRNFGDWIQEAGSFFLLSLVIKPSIVLTVLAIGNALAPEYATTLSGWPLLGLLAFYLLIDDVLQYWYHRSAHEYEWLWKLHRPHHQAEEMGFFISYRNAGLYYIIMPNIWWVALITFLGGGKAVAIGLIIKQFIIIGSHSTLHWDAPFYKHKFLKPIIKVLERIIITPAFHHAHHGKTVEDGISDPNGNYGNAFSFWDQLFGTAKFSHAYPTEIGLVNDTKDSWASSYLYPLVKSNKPNSEISKGYVKEKTTTLSSTLVELEKGKTYYYCQCGFSTNQPYCDGASHHGTKFKPLPFEAQRTGKARLCNCKLTKGSPFCDGSHKLD